MAVREAVLALWCAASAASAAAQPAASSATPALDDSLNRARTLLEQGDRVRARVELMQALRAHPSHPVALNFLGVVEAQDGRYRAAEARFREAILVAPGFADAYLNLGHLYQDNAVADPGAVTKALETYEALLRHEPSQPEALYQSAILHQARGEFSLALERVARLPDAQQRRAQVLVVRCASEAGLGHGKDADLAADALLAHAQLAEADVVSIVPVLSSHHRDDLSLRLLEGLRARGLAGPDGLQRLGAAYEAAGRLDAAREALEAAATSRPDAVPLLMDLARVAQKGGDRRGALGYLAHARELAPDDARIHFLFGMICVELELGVEAYNSLKKAVELDAENASFNYAMGAVSLHRRDPSEAVPYFRKYAALKPDDPRGPLGLGLAWFKAHEFESARPELERAGRSPSTAAAANYFLARIAREENDVPRALALVDLALQARPEYADAWAERGLLHLRQRDLEAAGKDLRRCLDLEPDNYLGNLNLLALYQRARDARQDEQARRVEELSARREEKADEFRRVIEVRP
jgi:tetratricopeptide (TPR) repeat protein